MKPSNCESLLWQLFIRLRRRRFLIGIEDYQALREALRAGYGWSSKDSLRALCAALWAKSKQESEVVGSLFDQLELPDWDLKSPAPQNTLSPTHELPEAQVDFPNLDDEPATSALSDPKVEIKPSIPATLPSRGLPAITVDEVLLPAKSFVFVPHFSLTPREAAQLGSYLRKTNFSTFLEDIDVNATVALRCRQGILGSIVRKLRRQKTKVMLLVDRQGSMTPFHQLSEMVCGTMSKSDFVGGVAIYYFHDVPVEGPDYRDLSLTLQDLSLTRGEPFQVLDDVWNIIPSLREGYIFEDEELLSPLLVDNVLRSITSDSIVIFVSDAGAARHHYAPQRLLDIVGFIKALRLRTNRYIWFNPLPQAYWAGTTAAKISRYIPMFPLDVEGLSHAASTLHR